MRPSLATARIASVLTVVLITGGIVFAARSLQSAGDALIVDDADQEFLQDGGEWRIARRGHDGQEWIGRYSKGQPVALWTFEDVAPGVYDLYATWEAPDAQMLLQGARLDTRARYRIKNGKRMASVTVNQSAPPSSDEGAWEELGRHKIAGGLLQVRLQPSGVRRVVLADAVMLVPRGPLPARPSRESPRPAVQEGTMNRPAAPTAPFPAPVTAPPAIPVTSGVTTPAISTPSYAPTTITTPSAPAAPRPTTSTGSNPAPAPSPVPTTTCTDTDGGQEKNTKGTATDASGPHTDYCISSNVLAEWTCWLGKASIIEQACNCVDGVCKGEVLSCTDSDGGNNKEVKGWISDVVYTKLWDSCPTPIGQFEYSCSGNRMVSTTNSCLCEDGVCKGTAPSCLDSDGGVNTGTKGAAYTTTGTGPDYCSSDLAINEAVCENGNISWVKVNCACKDGACTGPAAGTCTDSDGGINKDVKGKTQDTTYSGADWCKNMNLLVEDYCDNGKFASTEIACACSDGVCTGPVGPSCTETDGGIDTAKKGATTDQFGTTTDYCQSAWSLQEYNCSTGGSTVGSVHACACSDGACTGSACTDTDGGMNIATKGTVTSQYGPATDYCNGPTSLSEASCNGNERVVTTVTCSNCVDGACVSAPAPSPATGSGS